MTIYTAIEAASMISKRELKDDAVVSQGVQRVVDGGESDARLHATYALEDVGGAWMIVTGADGVEDRLPLWRHPEARAETCMLRNAEGRALEAVIRAAWLALVVLSYGRVSGWVRAHLVASAASYSRAAR